jgi:bacteriocin resistance YdeI/OmpD-like protein/uncharacterized protein DUF1905
MPESVRFRTRIEAARGGTASGGGAVAVIPAKFVSAIGGPRQQRVHGTMNGLAFKSSTQTYGGVYYVGLHKATREAAGVGFGDEVDLELTRDDAPRVLELAPELEAALAADAKLRATFDALSFTNRKEMSESIRTAVKPETRAARLKKAVDSLRA